jgi:hypothetical protein
MKHHLRAVANWCVGPRLQQEISRFWRNVGTSRLAANRQLTGRHAGERRCFVIGNGPSLKNMDLKPLANEFIIAANSFYKHPDASAIQVDYLCINDPHFMQDEPRCVEWHRTIAAKLPTTRFVLTSAARELVRKYHLYAGREVYFVQSGYPTHNVRSVNIDLSRPLNVGITTGTSVAMPLALALGFREIFLLGFDCNWMEDTKASYHFYDTHEYFPEFDSVATDGRGYSYEDELRFVQREFESHRLLREKAEQLGVRVTNVTVGGLLDAYPRGSFSDCFKQRESLTQLEPAAQTS